MKRIPVISLILLIINTILLCYLLIRYFSDLPANYLPIDRSKLLQLDDIPTIGKSIAGTITNAEVQKALNTYNDFLNKRVITGSGAGQTQTIREIILNGWCTDAECNNNSRVSIKIDKNSINELLKQQNADGIVVYPAIRNGKFTFILRAGANGEIVRQPNGQDILSYDDFQPCPPPRGCQ